MSRQVSFYKILLGLSVLILTVYLTGMGFAEECRDENGDPFETAYCTSEVDQCAQCINKANCKYPYMAKRKRIEGSVTVKCVVGTDGKVKATEILEATPKGVFEESVLAMVKKSKFRPAVKDGEKVASIIHRKINFTLPKK